MWGKGELLLHDMPSFIIIYNILVWAGKHHIGQRHDKLNEDMTEVNMFPSCTVRHLEKSLAYEETPTQHMPTNSGRDL